MLKRELSLPVRTIICEGISTRQARNRKATCVLQGNKSSPVAFLSSSAIGLLLSLFSAPFCPVPSFSTSSPDDEDADEPEEDETADLFFFSRLSLKVHQAGMRGFHVVND